MKYRVGERKFGYAAAQEGGGTMGEWQELFVLSSRPRFGWPWLVANIDFDP